MKAEERHRLHENDLQRLTEQARERSRPFLEQYGTTLLLALAALLLVAAAVIWFVKRSSSGRGEGWSELDAAFRNPGATAEDFANVAEVAKGSPAADWARLYEGESHLASGIESLFTDRDGAGRDLESAKESFEAALAAKDATPELTARALYGLGRTLEASSTGDVKPALDRYEQITAGYEDSIYAKLARERIDSLKSADAKAFYAWFSKQKPAPKDPLQRPADTGPGPPTPPGGAAVTPPAGGPSLGAGEAAAPAGEAAVPAAEAGDAAASPAEEGGGTPPASETPASETPDPGPESAETPPTDEPAPAPQ